MHVNDYDLIVVGSGFVGSVTAYLAAKEGRRVLLLERRDHIGGNMYDYVDSETGICVQKYGPHSFHTNDDCIYDFVTSIWQWYPFTLTARVEMQGRFTPSPFNFSTIEEYFPSEKAREIQKNIAEEFRYAPKATILELLSSTNQVVREYANFLFENDYRPYTAKQWGIAPENLDISVLSRVPVRFDYIDRYFDDRYQMMPEKGFTAMFEKLLEDPLIDVRLKEDALNHFKADAEQGILLYENVILDIPVVYTGAVDELFRGKYGRLPYRSLQFELKSLETESFQPTPGVAYPLAEGYTRVTEYTKLPPQNGNGKTIIAYEFPIDYAPDKDLEPYYPVLTAQSREIYKCYTEDVKKIHNLYPCGRLADFKYYNMDQAILRALEVYGEIAYIKK